MKVAPRILALGAIPLSAFLLTRLFFGSTAALFAAIGACILIVLAITAYGRWLGMQEHRRSHRAPVASGSRLEQLFCEDTHLAELNAAVAAYCPVQLRGALACNILRYVGVMTKSVLATLLKTLNAEGQYTRAAAILRPGLDVVYDRVFAEVAACCYFRVYDSLSNAPSDDSFAQSSALRESVNEADDLISRFGLRTQSPHLLRDRVSSYLDAARRGERLLPKFAGYVQAQLLDDDADGGPFMFACADAFVGKYSGDLAQNIQRSFRQFSCDDLTSSASHASSKCPQPSVR